jgi:nucleotide-binding universal stress UspA family protein
MQIIPEIRKILFTSDLTEPSKHAFSYALSLAVHYNAQLIFLYVMEELPANVKAFLGPEIEESFLRRAREAKSTLIGKRREIAMIQSCLQQFYDNTLKNLDNSGDAVEHGDVIISEGNVVGTIIQTALEQNCDAIILGSRRRGALSDVMFGSVTKGVLRHSDRLVIVAPPLPKIE